MDKLRHRFINPFYVVGVFVIGSVASEAGIEPVGSQLTGSVACVTRSGYGNDETTTNEPVRCRLVPSLLRLPNHQT